LSSSKKLPVNSLKRMLRLLFASLLILAVVIFMLENEQSVIINVFGWSSSALPLSIFIVVALLIGMIIGPMLGVIVRRRHKIK
jgi:uncharacterized integral membrane protein